MELSNSIYLKNTVNRVLRNNGVPIKAVFASGVDDKFLSTSVHMVANYRNTRWRN